MREAGGYELVRATPSRLLEVIPVPADGYTTTYLKEVVGQGKIYIRPIQRDIPLEPILSTTVSYVTTRVGGVINMALLNCSVLNSLLSNSDVLY